MRSKSAAPLALLALGLALAIHGHASNGPVSFYAGVLALAIGLGPATWWAGRGVWPPTLLKFGVAGSAYVLALLVLEVGWRAIALIQPPPEEGRFPTFGDAQADPAAFRRWWSHMGKEFITAQRFTMPDPLGLNPYVLKPGAVVMGKPINGLGFRGDEITREKGALFRIVAIGESTTFGLTRSAEERTWPELLEERIRREYRCRAPVQVVNAGVPGWTLANQLLRLQADILPLEPDLIVSYHGYNGFDFFLKSLAPVRANAGPMEKDRPSRILAELEFSLRLWDFRRRYSDTVVLQDGFPEVDLHDNAYTFHYRQLISRARENHIRIAIATFNLAVDEHSPEEVVRWYEQIVPDVRARIAANRIHTALIEALGREQHMTVIDASPGLDGAYRDMYVDIVHFTQPGRERLAANLLGGLRRLLERHPRLRCRPAPAEAPADRRSSSGSAATGPRQLAMGGGWKPAS